MPLLSTVLLLLLLPPSSSLMPPPPPLFTVGVVADVQHAPVPDGFSYGGTPRYYEAALPSLQEAVRNFGEEGVDFVVNLGDSVDALCKSLPDPLAPALAVKSALDVFSGPVHSVYGNHELEVLSRPEIERVLGVPMHEEEGGELVGRYSVRVGEGWRFVFLDTYDTCVQARTGAKLALAESLLSTNNPNYSLGSPNSPVGLEGTDRRFVAFNGGVGPAQLSWLASELAAARLAGDRAVLLAHQPFHPATGSSMCLPFNYEEVLAVAGEYSDVVKATFAGHAHSGGHHLSPTTGIHHLNFAAVLESPPGVSTHSIVRVYEDRLVVEGFGREESRVLEMGGRGKGDGEECGGGREEIVAERA